jgi:hypothetical protein
VPRIETNQEQLIRRKDLATQPIHPTKITRPHHRHRHAFTVSSTQSPTQVTVSISSEQDKIYEPTNYAYTIHSPDENLWKAAIQDEFNSFMTKNLVPLRSTTWKLRYSFKIKPGSHGPAAR